MKKNVNRILSILLMFCVLLSLSGISVLAADTGEFDPPGNLLLNPGFEDGDTGAWRYNQADGNFMKTGFISFQHHSGYTCALLGAHTGDWSYFVQEVTVPVSGLYELSCYFFPLVYNSSTVQITIDNPENGEMHTIQFTGLDMPWNKYSLEARLTGGVTYRISFAAKSNTCLDDVSLTLQSEQILKNEGFENALNGWTQQGVPAAFSTDAQARSGKNSLYLGYFQNEALLHYVEQTVTSAAGSYDFSVWIKTGESLSGIGAAIFLDAKNADGTVLATASSPAVSDSQGEWKRVSVHLTAPSGTAAITAKIGGVYCTGAFYADDAQLLYQPI